MLDGRVRSLDVRAEPIRRVEDSRVVAVEGDHPSQQRMSLRPSGPSELRGEERLPTPLGDRRDVPTARIRCVLEDDTHRDGHLLQESSKHRRIRHVGRGQRPRVDQSLSFHSALADHMELAEMVDREPSAVAEAEPLPSGTLLESRRVRVNRSKSSARFTEFFWFIRQSGGSQGRGPVPRTGIGPSS